MKKTKHESKKCWTVELCILRNARNATDDLLFFFFHWHYHPLWALACRTMSFHFFLSATNSLHLLTPSTWRSLSTSSFHLFLGLLLLLVLSSSWVQIFLGILSSSILSRRPNQLLRWPFIHFTIFYGLYYTCINLDQSTVIWCDNMDVK